MKTNIRNTNKKFVLFTIIFILISSLIMPFCSNKQIQAFAKDIADEYNSIFAQFNDNVSIDNLKVHYDQKTIENDFSKINISVIRQIESYMKSKTKLDYRLIMIGNVYFERNGIIESNVEGLEKLIYNLSFDGNISNGVNKDFCVIARLQTSDNANELKEIFNSQDDSSFIALMNSISIDNLELVQSNTFISDESNINNIQVSFLTQQDGIYFLYQLEENKITIKTLIFIFEILACVIILVLLIITIHKRIKQKSLQSINSKKENDTVIKQKNELLDLDKTEIQKLNLTRKISFSNAPNIPRPPRSQNIPGVPRKMSNRVNTLNASNRPNGITPKQIPKAPKPNGALQHRFPGAPIKQKNNNGNNGEK